MNQDETKDPTKDSLQGTGPAAGGDPGTTSGEDRTYSQAEVDKMVLDEKSAAGRKTVEITKENTRLSGIQEATAKRLENTQAQLLDLQKRIDDQELDKAREDPSALTLYQQRKGLRDKEAALSKQAEENEKRAGELKAEAEELSEFKRKKVLDSVAEKHGVDVKTLEELNITDEAQLDAVAAALAGRQATQASTSVDSGLSSGTPGAPTIEQLEKMDPDQYAEYWRKREKK